MKTIKIFFTGFWSDFSVENNMFTSILKKRYNVVIDSSDPDFLICSPLGKPYEYMKYNCPRIMYTGEFISADFTAIDYFIGFDDISFGDRCLRFPLFLYNSAAKPRENAEISVEFAVKELKSKKYFCNYIFGHDTALGKREEILEKMQSYKRVECAGKHRNNMPDGKTFSMLNKHKFMRECKFSICAESVCYPGFTSEKLCHAFDAYTIPVYYGDPDVLKDFNEMAFIDCYRYDSIDDAIEKVVEIDQNEDLFVKMLIEKRYNVENYEKAMFEKLEAFLYNIFDQEKEAAYRRPRFYRSMLHESYLKDYNEFESSVLYRTFKKLKK